MSSEYEIIPVTLSPKEWTDLCSIFIKHRFSGGSVELFEETLQHGDPSSLDTLATAVLEAVRNEACTDAIIAMMDQSEATNPPDQTNPWIELEQTLQSLVDIKAMMPAEDKTSSVTPTVDKSIWVTFQKEGVHRYPAAETQPDLATGGWDDVSFLSYPHRHIFHFRVGMEVFHDDRDVEFIQLKRWCERLYANGVLQLDFKSCEMISDDLYSQLSAQWPNRKITIEVSEDGENGSYATYLPGELK